MTLPQELQAARLRLVKARPYLASAAWALQPISKPGLCSMAVDMHWRLYYDSAVLISWPVEAIEGILYHEICHLLRNHSQRMQGFDPTLSNLAADAEINDDLAREGIKFPVKPVTPESIGQPENLLAEEYYFALLNQKQSSSAGQNQNRAQPDSPEEEGNANSNRSDQPDRTDNTGDNISDSVQEKEKKSNDSAPQNYSQNEIPSPGSGRCGSCATGQKASWEDEVPSSGSSCGISPIESELLRRDVANQIREYSRGQGRVPGHWARWAEEKLQPKVNWRKQLAATVRCAVIDTNGATDYSYRRPSRRQGQVGKGDVIFPSMRCPLPSVAIVADTSASISDNMLDQALAEIAAILKSLGQKEGIHVLAVDRTVQSCDRVFRPEQVQLTGGGGTDMRVGLKAISSLRPLPQLGIIITDGQTEWPECPPRGTKYIVVLSGDGNAPEWTKIINISEQ